MRQTKELRRYLSCLVIAFTLSGCASVYSSHGLPGTWALQLDADRVELAINPQGYGFRRVIRDRRTIEQVELVWTRGWVGFVIEERSRGARAQTDVDLGVLDGQRFPHRYSVHGIMQDGVLRLRVEPLREHLFNKTADAWVF